MLPPHGAQVSYGQVQDVYFLRSCWYVPALFQVSDKIELIRSGCYGIASQDMGPEWECELCLNAKQEDNHLVRLLSSDSCGMAHNVGTPMSALPAGYVSPYHQDQDEESSSGL